MREKEKIWLSPMTKAFTPTVKFKMKRDNTKNATKNFDYTMIAGRLHPTCMFEPVNERSTGPLTAKAV